MKKMEGTFVGADGRISGYDLKLTNQQPNDLVVFAHGFMGFKDWGCWDLVQDYFVENGLSFLKYNVSHNGVTLEQPTDFA
ncbi:MAG: alpha/beta hydrolase, partial [Bacteroidetes bacterium]